MKAVTCLQGELSVHDGPELAPGKGQLLLDVLRCGICGSDLHLRHACNHFADMMARAGYHNSARSTDAVVFGHEFCGEVIGHGSGCKRRLKPGTRVVSLPFLRRGTGIEMIGLSMTAPGAYAEQLVIEESLALPVPNGLAADLAAMTEPMSVAWHAVRRGEVKKGDLAIVIGCGPIGLAVICLLKAAGVRTVVASDLSPGRRALAKTCRADVVIDPTESSPFDNRDDAGFVQGMATALEMAVGGVEKLKALPLPWWHAWRVAETLGATAPKRPVVFECVGAPGLLQSVINGAPMFTRIVAVGVCMKTDQFEPALAINKEIDLRFALGYTPLEFRDCLHMIAEGKINCAPLVTGTVGLHGVEAAFAAMSVPDRHAKILIDPKSPARAPV